MLPKRRVFFLTSLTVLLLVATPMFAGDTATVLAVTTAADGAEDSELSDVLSQFIAIELQRYGVTSVPRTEPGPGEQSLRDLFRMAKQADAAYVLSSVYELTREGVKIDFTWLDAETKAEVVTTSRSGPVDLHFDSLVAGAIAELREGATAAGAWPEAVSEATTDSAGTGDAIPEISPLSTPPSRRLITAISAAPFLVNGRASDYFKFGFMPSAFAGYSMGAGAGVLSLGAHVSYGLFITEGDLEGVKIQTVPVGPELRYASRSILPFDVFARLAAGAAFLRLDVGDGWRSKIVPFGSLGIGASWPLGQFLEIGFEMSYTAMVEKIHPILGFTPALSVTARM